jgi:site-specific DNA-methyltransferase (adenine-specific)
VSEKAGFSLKNRNPDVLTSIANLSNDEVFTPPSFANQMLDTVEDAWAKSNKGAIIWEDKNVTFLDPFTKSGVFLREITRRLSKGLEKQIPDVQERVNHILTKQVFGVAITELTALLARRSLYCSKFANGEHSICTEFETPEGNIWFERTEHTWVGGKEKVITVDDNGKEIEVTLDGTCKFCGAKQKEYERGLDAESHAYALIHTDDPKTWVKNTFGENMQFDVIVGNPPYQLNDGGGEGASASPLYQKFVTQAVLLSPRALVMVIPARWYTGGKGLDEFRKTMLDEARVEELHDFPETELVFPGVNIRGGVCYFLLSQGQPVETKVVNHFKGRDPVADKRFLRREGIEGLIRYNEAISILEKVGAKSEETYGSRVASRNHFGIPANFTGYSPVKSEKTPITLYRSRRGSSSDKEVYVSHTDVGINLASKDRIKVLVSKASPGGDEYPHAIFSEPILALENSVCTETYLIVDFLESQEEAAKLISYMKTRFFRFLVSLLKPTQNISKSCFDLVPLQKLDRVWTDEQLYAKYQLTQEEIAFIESMIRPMDTTDA